MCALRIAICEDSDDDAEFLGALIKGSGAELEISRFKTGGAFLASRPIGRFDIAFFDIYMGSLSGVEAARILREADDRCGVVFTTSSEDFRAEAFDIGAEQYLVKPVDREKLMGIIGKRTPDRRRKSCLINIKGKHLDIPFDDIIYVEVKNHNCIVHTKDDMFDTGTTMTIQNFRQLLPPPRFMRCHKSYIVNLSFVESLDRDFLMKNGDTVYVRRSDLARCKKYESNLDKWRLDEAGRDDD
jgi:DNA-binding LytR/AlgR family response regulator